MDSAKPCSKSTSGASGLPAVRAWEVRAGAIVIFASSGMDVISNAHLVSPMGGPGGGTRTHTTLPSRGLAYLIQSQESNWCFCRRLRPWQEYLGRADTEYRARRYRASTSQAAPIWTT